jgi:nucleoside-diphosphate-sugar epimerase
LDRRPDPAPHSAPEAGHKLTFVRIFIAGSSGVIGTRLIPLLIKEGHTIAGMTRSPDKASMLGAEAVVCDVFDDAARQSLPTLVLPPGVTLVADDCATAGARP